MMRTSLYSILAIIVAAAAVYANTLGNGFVFDDIDFIVNNPRIHRLDDVGAIWHYWPTRFIAMWTFALNIHWQGLSVAGFHIFNIFIHIGASLGVWWLIRSTFQTPALRGHALCVYRDQIALWAGLIFAVHPIQTESVTYIYQRCASLAVFFYLAALVLYVRTRLNEEAGTGSKMAQLSGRCAAVLCALLALFTKEIAITIPIMIALYESFFFRTSGIRSIRRAVPFVTASLLLPAVLIFGPARHELVQLERDTPEITLAQYMTTEFRVVMTYIRYLFLPFNQNLDHDYPITRFPWLDSYALLSAACILLLIGMAVRLRHRQPMISFGMIWFFVSLIPESTVIILNQVLFEHRLYLPMVGFCFAFPVVLYHACGAQRQAWARGALALFIGMCAVLTVQRNTDWKDGITLWTDVIEKSPLSARAYANRGRSYVEEGRIAEGLADINMALAIDPSFAIAYDLRGVVHLNQGNFDQAIADYSRAIALGPTHMLYYRDRAEAYFYKKDYANSWKDLKRAEELGFNLRPAWVQELTAIISSSK